MREWDKHDVRPDGLGREPNLLIVANASGSWMWETWQARSAIGREVASLAKNQGIQYDQSTATRRRVLFDRFAAALKTEEGQRGVLVQIDRSPFQVVDALPSPAQVGERAYLEISDRAKEARTALGAGPCSDVGCLHTAETCVAKRRWKDIAAFNTAVPTTLAPIGAKAYEALTAHARTSTAAYLYVLHGIGSTESFDEPPLLS